jgi:sulfite reductase alpha subunit
VYDENARKKERVGDFLMRIGLQEFFRLAKIEPSAELFSQPRSNLYYHWDPAEIKDERIEPQPSKSEN